MFRLTKFLRELIEPTPVRPRRDPPGPVVIWNLVRRCNLLCKHCYSISGDVDFEGELTTAEVFRVLDDLKAARVPAVILSGGEPLLRPDIYDIAERAKSLGLSVSLSSNGALIDDAHADRIAAAKFDYVGVSLDGIGATHDRFRGRPGCFDASMAGIRRLHVRGVKVGLRFTMTSDNEAEFSDLVDLARREDAAKFYLSHLVYSGRGNKNRLSDSEHAATRATMLRLFDEAWADVQAGSAREWVTGNNDADGAFLWMWVKERFPERADHMRGKLAEWGGNACGVNVANIDNLGHVHPDTFWWDKSIGNVRERPFGAVWADTSDPLMAGLKARPRRISGRCGECTLFDMCGGNTRVRAYRLTGDAFAEDPACYLDDAEIGITAPRDRLANKPFRGLSHEPYGAA